jgi:hypothetical protein
MRSIKLAPALAATATLLALAPAGASAAGAAAAKHHPKANGPGKAQPGVTHHGGSCRINIAVAPRAITSGESVTVSGRLACPSGAAGQPVTVWEQTSGKSSFSVAGSTTTEVDGSYKLPPMSLIHNTLFYARSGGVISATRTARVAAQVTLTSAPADGAELFTGSGSVHSHASAKVTFSGQVSPADKGSVVALQREASTATEEWKRIGGSTVNGEGKFTITHTFVVPGAASIRVVVRPGHRNVAGASETRSYEISQAQNPALTIETTADPVIFGQPVTISGTVAGPPTQPVTLMAEARGGSFAAVASGTTKGGHYAFPETPLVNTFYKVTSGSTSSSQLYEGVKYALTAGVTPSLTVQAGQPLLFSGTVAPGHNGHPIYLERQNPSGIGFHVVQKGAVEGSTYKITHAFFSAAATPFVVRIKIPGDEENQQASSELFKVQVTPAAASALTPEAPGNSRLPGEGQT